MSAEKNLIRFDWAMKRLLRNKANFSILEGFLSELLKEQICIKNLLESEGNQETPEAKYNRVDLLAENSHGDLILIEVQNNREVDYFQRMVFATSSLITQHLQKGEPYLSVKKIYSVNILYFDLGQGEDYIYHGRTTFEGMNKGDILKLSSRQKSLYRAENPSDILPEYYVIKVNQFDDHAKNTLDEWIFYLKNNSVKESFRAQGLDHVREILKIDAMPEQERKTYKAFLSGLEREQSVLFTAKDEGLAEGLAQGLAQGLEQGLEQGLAKGKDEANRDNARKMKQRGLSINDIADITGLNVEDIRDL